ncbi:MAG: DUF2845 domain-containing protein [Desulfobacterales bacterium]
MGAPKINMPIFTRAKRFRFLLLLGTFLFQPWFQVDTAAETTLRCAGGLVSVGDTAARVLEICGEPTAESNWEEGHNTYTSQIFDYEKERYQLPKLIKGPIRMALWTYDLGSNKFVRTLHFENERLIRIETGEKGRN